jgi:hypothetical protein
VLARGAVGRDDVERQEEVVDGPVVLVLDMAIAGEDVDGGGGGLDGDGEAGVLSECVCRWHTNARFDLGSHRRLVAVVGQDQLAEEQDLLRQAVRLPIVLLGRAVAEEEGRGRIQAQAHGQAGHEVDDGCGREEV